MVNSPINKVHAVLHAAYVKAGNAETQSEGATKGEEAFARAIKGATLEDICEATGLSMSEVQTMMAQISDHVMHRGIDPVTGAAPKRATEYALKIHQQGEPEWRPGIDF